jgi:hypothetical protein
MTGGPGLANVAAFAPRVGGAVPLVIFVAAFLRYAFLIQPNIPFPQTPEPIKIARTLVEKGEYADPFHAGPTGPTAHVTPGFPLLAAALLLISGPRWGFALRLAAVACTAVMVSSFPYAARRLGLGWETGVVAAILWLGATPDLYPHFESSWAAAVNLAVTLVAAAWIGAPSLARALAFGIACGVALLLLATGLPALVAILMLACFSVRKQCLVAVLATAAVIAPWMVRNFQVLGGWVPFRSNFGLELAVSNNDCASFSLQQNLDTGCHITGHPNQNATEAAKVREMGEIAYNRQRLRDALDWIRANPRRFLALTAERILAFWFPHDTHDLLAILGTPGYRLHFLMTVLLTPLGFAGLAMLCRSDRLSASLLAAWLALYPLVYYVIQSSDRYRLPVLWVTYLLGALPIRRLLDRLASHWASRARPPLLP